MSPESHRHRDQPGVNKASGGIFVGAPVHEQGATAQGCPETMATSDADQRTVGDEPPRYADESARAGEAPRFIPCGSHEINGDHRTPRR